MPDNPKTPYMWVGRSASSVGVGWMSGCGGVPDAFGHRKITWPLIGWVAAHGIDDPNRRASSHVCPHSAEQSGSECFFEPAACRSNLRQNLKKQLWSNVVATSGCYKIAPKLLSEIATSVPVGALWSCKLFKDLLGEWCSGV